MSINKRELKEQLRHDFMNAPVSELHKVITPGRMLEWAKSYAGKTKFERVFGNIDRDLVVGSVENAVSWIMNDRISEGVGEGGWGKSEKAWMIHVFGEEAGSSIKEAIFSTVVAMEALKAHTDLRELQPLANGCYHWDDVETQLLKFLIDDGRYSESSGRAGKLGLMGSDGNRDTKFDFRHTAIILRLWNLQSKWTHYYQTTTDALVEGWKDSDFVKLKTERVVTWVMAHKALIIMKASCCESLKYEIEERLKVIRGKIVGSFDKQLYGWPAKPVEKSFTEEQSTKSRNYYTLLTLAMIPEEWDGNNDELKKQMTQGMDQTFELYLRSEPDLKSYYIRQPDSEQPDLCATLIAFSALARKPELTKMETAISQGISQYIVRRFGSVDFDYHNPYDRPYSWVVPYFVVDACKVLMEE